MGQLPVPRLARKPILPAAMVTLLPNGPFPNGITGYLEGGLLMGAGLALM